MGRVETFLELRPLLFSIAYRMLGSVGDAEDVLQDAYLRWQTVPDDEPSSPRSYLATVVTRLCIDHLRSARVRREEYVGPWLPEPLVTEGSADVAEHVELADSVSMAFLVLLEALSPLERAVFVLREVFGFGYDEVSRIVDRSEEACRQLALRARRHVEERRPRFDVDRRRHKELTERFLVAAGSGDVGSLVELLADDVVLWSDGGGKVRAARRPIAGAGRVARFVVGIGRFAPPNLEFRPAQVNGQPGALMFAGHRPYGAIVLEVLAGRIQAVRFVVNPDKLRSVGSAARSGVEHWA